MGVAASAEGSQRKGRVSGLLGGRGAGEGRGEQDGDSSFQTGKINAGMLANCPHT